MPPRTVLFVATTLPSPASTAPRQRQRFRRLLDYAAVPGAVVDVLALEPLAWGDDAATLRAAGVEVVDAAPADRRAHAEAVARADLVVVADDPALAVLVANGALGALAPDAALVLDLPALAPLEVAAARPLLAARDPEGIDQAVAAWEGPLRSAAPRAALVVVADDSSAAAVRALAPTTPVAVVAPSAPSPAGPTVPAPRQGVAVAAPDLVLATGADDEALRWFAETVVPGLGRLADDGLVEVTGLGARPAARATGGLRERPAPGAADPSQAVDLDDVLARVRVVALARGAGSPLADAVVELAGAGVPFVARAEALGPLAASFPGAVVESGTGMATRLVALATDGDAWTAERDACLAFAGAHHDPAAQRRALHHALAGVVAWATAPAADAAAMPPAPAPGAPPCTSARRPPVATLAALDRRVDADEWRLLPGEVMRREVSRLMQSVLPADERYRLWRVKNPPLQPVPLDALAWQPTVSVVTPVHDTDPQVLTETIESVLAQTYPHWQLCIADDASRSRATRAVLDDHAARDPRIVVRRLDANCGIAGASNAALELVTGELTGLLDHDDVLAPDALWWVVRRFARCPDLDLVYTDEDKLDAHGNRTAPFFKPDWSPDLFLGVNYLAHFLVVRTELLRAAGGWRTGFDGSQDFDLLLRLTERTDRIGHVARPLYSWRMVAGSTSADPSAKPAADEAGRRALADALARRALDADVSGGDAGATRYRPVYRRTTQPTVSVVIPTRDRVELLSRCLDSMRGRSEVPVELVIVDNQSSDPATLSYLAGLERDRGARIVRYPHPFNYARQMNLGCLAATGDYLLMLNNDAIVASDGWLEAMVEHAQRPEVGMVGARLVYPDGRSQHEGIVLGMGGVAYNADFGGYFSLGDLVHNCLAVTAAVAMMRPAVFHAVGGFDERLAVAFNDVDLCLRVGELGYRVLYTPHAVICHEESASRGSLHPTADDDFAQRRWGAPRALRDPFCNPALEWFNPFMLRL